MRVYIAKYRTVSQRVYEVQWRIQEFGMRSGLPLPSLPCPPLFLPSPFLCSLLPLHLPSPLSSLPL